MVKPEVPEWAKEVALEIVRKTADHEPLLEFKDTCLYAVGTAVVVFEYIGPADAVIPLYSVVLCPTERASRAAVEKVAACIVGGSDPCFDDIAELVGCFETESGAVVEVYVYTVGFREMLGALVSAAREFTRGKRSEALAVVSSVIGPVRKWRVEQDTVFFELEEGGTVVVDLARDAVQLTS